MLSLNFIDSLFENGTFCTLSYSCIFYICMILVSNFIWQKPNILDSNIFGPKIFWCRKFRNTHKFWIPNFFLTQIFLDPKYIGSKIFGLSQIKSETKKHADHKYLGHQIYLIPKNFCSLKFVGTQMFSGPKLFRNQLFFGQTLTSDLNGFTQNFFDQKLLDQKISDLDILNQNFF